MSADSSNDPTILANCPVCGGPRSKDSALCELCLQRGLTRVPTGGPAQGLQIGSYVLTEPLGEGGMGFVWLAAHVREERIRAAVKFIRHEANPERFLAERRHLASLAHPNIARIYDVGQTQDGALYLTMEFVEHGEPLTKWCDARSLSIPARLRLFQEVCHAVQHVHLKGLIHRDLKPANILVAPVDGQPVPRIIDFGIAKPIADAGGAEFADPSLPALDLPGEEGALLTRAGRFVGTLEYSSPEQLRGEKVDPRSDVYALGLILYELLTGLRPHSKEEMNLLRERAGITRKAASSLSDEDLSRLAGVLAAERPTAPSERLRRATTTTAAATLEELAAKRGLTAQALPRVLGRDLEAIIMKALGAAPDDRYASPDALAADLENHLQRRPVTAIPPTLPYLTRKFLHRYPWQAAAVAALVMSLAGGILASSKFARSESLAKSVAVKAFAEAEIVRNLAEERFYAADLQGTGFDLSEARVAAARSRLDTHSHEASGRDLRGWEYFYFRSRMEQNLLLAPAHAGGVNATALSPDGTTLATGGQDKTVALWEAASLLPLRRFTGHKSAVVATAWSPDGKYVASCDGGEMIIWRAEDGQRFASLHGADGSLRALAWSPETSGQPLRLALGGKQHEILVADIPPDGGELSTRTLARRQNYVTGLVWSPDGSRLAASHLLGHGEEASEGRTGVAVFDAVTGRLLTASKPIQGSDTYAVAWHPDGRWLAAGDKHSAVRIIDLMPRAGLTAASGEPALVPELPVAPLNLHREFVSAVAWLPMSEFLASASGDGTLRYYAHGRSGDWTGEPRFGHRGPVLAVAAGLQAASGPGEEGQQFPVLYSGGADGTLRAWLAGQYGVHSDTGMLSSWVSSIKFRPGRRVAAAGRFGGGVWLIDTRNWRYEEMPGIRGSYVFDVDWSPDGRQLALACNGSHTVEIHAPWQQLQPEADFPLSYVRHVAWSRSGRYLAAAGRSECAVWDDRQKQVICTVAEGAGSLVWGPDDTGLAIGGRDGHISLWNPLTNSRTRLLRPAPPPIPELVANENEPPRQVHDLRWSPAGPFLLYGTQDGVAAVLDPSTGEERIRLAHRHINGIWRVAWSPDGTQAATAGQDGTLRIFNARNGLELARLDHGEGSKEIRGLDWSGDGDAIVTAGFDQKVRVWDAGRGRRLEKAETLSPQAIGRMDRETARTTAREMLLIGRTDLALAAGRQAAQALTDPAAAATELDTLRAQLRLSLTDPTAILNVPEDELPESPQSGTHEPNSPGRGDYAAAALRALSAGDRDRALAILDRGLKAFPDSTTILNHRGVVLWAGFEDYAAALTALRKSRSLAASETKNDFARQLSNCLTAACLYASGEKEEARALLAPLMAQSPDLELPSSPSSEPWPEVVSSAFRSVKAAAASSPSPSPDTPKKSAPRYKEVDAR